MKVKKIAAVYSIIVGISMIGMWTVFYVTGGIPEINTEPAKIIMHLIAEFVTAASLILGGFGFISNRKWGFQAYLLSMGMLMYILIVSSGYYIQSSDFIFVAMFAVFIILALVFIVMSYLKREKFEV
jgi:hypothetical protein